MSCCNPSNPCSSNIPETCEALPTTNAAARLVVEDEANCKKTMPAPETPSLLVQTATGNTQWADGSAAKPINLSELKNTALAEGLVGKNANGDVAELVRTPAETEDEIALLDDTGWKVKTASEIFGASVGVAVRETGGPASWVTGTEGQILKINSSGVPEFSGSNLQSGTTAQRPVLGSSDRAIYYNTTLSIFEWWDGVQWMTASSQRRSDEVVVVFTASNPAWPVPTGITTIKEVLVVAGGGSGGKNWGGGGGGGGVTYATDVAVAGTVAVVIGSGGAAVVADGKGNAGTNSSFGAISATGGGYGGSYTAVVTGGNGGSGGGGGLTGLGGTGTALQGYNGGEGVTGTSAGGGGGGATQAGNSSGTGVGGNGGAGFSSSLSGSPLAYGGGGGGAGATNGTGGTGGGGNGGGVAGGANMGGGGGGCLTAVASSGAGGSGVVIIKY